MLPATHPLAAREPLAIRRGQARFSGPAGPGRHARQAIPSRTVLSPNRNSSSAKSAGGAAACWVMAAVRRGKRSGSASRRYAFVKPDEVAGRVSPLLARRIAACVDALRAGTVISLEDGYPVA